MKATVSKGALCPHCQHSENEPQLEVISRLPSGAPKNFPPLLFVHGGWHGASCWDEYFLPYFASQGYECHALSLRGHGRSEGKERMNFHSVADFTRDICRIASNLREPPVIVAHSFGGFLTAHYMLHHKPAAVAMLTPVPPNGLFSISLRWMTGIPARFFKALFTFNPASLIQSPKVAKRLFFSDSMADEKVLRFHTLLGGESYRAFLDGLFLNRPARPRADYPVLVVAAGNDRVVGAKDNQFTADFLGAKLISIKDIAHDVMLDDPWQKAADVLKDFLASVNQTAAL